jgi:CRP-like cAMP-binding protein
MPPIAQASVRNRLLKALPAEAYELLSPSLKHVELSLRYDLVEAFKPTTTVYFLESGLGSIVASSADNESTEVGHIGREGVSGTHLLLMSDRTPNKTFMQVAGEGLSIPASHFVSLVETHAFLRNYFLRYVQTAEIQLAQSALANARYSVNERLARWILMCHDRIDGDDLPLTHEFLALMLGTRRSGVTDQIHILEGAHVIKATRGHVHVINRAKLEDIAGGCYGIPEQEYDRLMSTPFEFPG